eukprot:3644213-Rhodomonas_salina.1
MLAGARENLKLSVVQVGRLPIGLGSSPRADDASAFSCSPAHALWLTRMESSVMGPRPSSCLSPRPGRDAASSGGDAPISQHD